jgi:hypothetical protein
MTEPDELDELTLTKLRSMKPYDRVALGMKLNEALRNGLEAVIRTLHPEWTNTDVRREISCRILAGEISVDRVINCSFALAEPRTPKSISDLIH